MVNQSTKRFAHSIEASMANTQKTEGNPTRRQIGNSL